LDQEPTIAVRQPDPARHLTPQYVQLTADRCVLCFKPTIRLEWHGKMPRMKYNSAIIAAA
jgi:hypothetical protein